MRTKLYIKVDEKSVQGLNDILNASIRNVGRGTKHATEDALRTIYDRSREQVPKDTLTLYNSAYYTVNRRSDTAKTTWAYEGSVGYGLRNNINPKNGLPATAYMVQVHEDLTQRHKNGKAKFLEDPIIAYANSHFRRNYFERLADSLGSTSKSWHRGSI